MLAATRVRGADALRDVYESRQRLLADYRAAYRRYCWSVAELGDYELAMPRAMRDASSLLR